MSSSKSICECFPEGRTSFVGVYLGPCGKSDRLRRVFNITSEEIEVLCKNEIDSPIVIDATNVDDYFENY